MIIAFTEDMASQLILLTVMAILSIIYQVMVKPMQTLMK